MWGDGWRASAQTSHFVTSFPLGTDPEAVTKIVDGVCNEVFNSGDRTFEYIAGVHMDAHHPHAHVIVNRLGSDRSLLLMRRRLDYDYAAIKEVIVAHGEQHGVNLQSTGRVAELCRSFNRILCTKGEYLWERNKRQNLDRKLYV